MDDTNIINAAKSVDTTGEDLLIQQQKVMDTWKGSLNATGGALRPDKSYWYMQDYKHSGNQWKYKSIKQLPGEFTVKVSDGTRQTLLRLKLNEAKETLGICISMDGNSKDQLEHLLKRTRHMAEDFRTSKVTKKEAWYTLTTAFLKTIEYPMEATRLTKAQCTQVMIPLLSIAL